MYFTSYFSTIYFINHVIKYFFIDRHKETRNFDVITVVQQTWFHLLLKLCSVHLLKIYSMYWFIYNIVYISVYTVQQWEKYHSSQIKWSWYMSIVSFHKMWAEFYYLYKILICNVGDRSSKNVLLELYEILIFLW